MVNKKGLIRIIEASIAILIIFAALFIVFMNRPAPQERDLGRIIKRLEKQEMISLREKGQQVEIVITEKGERRLLEYDFEELEFRSLKRDGKWRLIMFDIPNEKKNARDSFRRKLEQLGCVRLQESIYVSAFPCKDEVDFLCHFLEISDFVSIVVLEKIERGEQLIFKKYYSGPI